MEVGLGITERGLAQGQEAVDVPASQHLLVGVDVDREVEEVGHVRDSLAILRQLPGLQHIQAFDDQDVGAVDLDRLVRHHVIDQMRVDRRAHRASAGLHVGKEAQQRRQVIALRKALPFHQAFAFEHGIRQQEAVGGDEIDLRHVRPAREQRLQHARGGRLADRHRAADADDVGHLGVLGAEEFLLRDEQPLGRRHVHRQETRERQINLLDLLHVEPIVQRAHARHFVRRQRHRRVFAQRRPLIAREDAVGRNAVVGTLFHALRQLLN